MLDAIILSVHDLGVPLHCLDISLGWGLMAPPPTISRVQFIEHAVPASLCTQVSDPIRTLISFDYVA